MSIFNSVTPIRKLSEKLELLIHGKLWLQVLIGLIIGMIVGVLLGPDVRVVQPDLAEIIAEWLALPGLIFLRLIKMIAIPLVIISIIRGIGAQKNLAELKSTGLKLLAFVVTTTTIAIVTGIFLANTIKPGVYVKLPEAQNQAVIQIPHSAAGSGNLIKDLPSKVTEVIPDNPFQTILDAEMLGIVVFSIIIGIAFASQPKRKASSLLNLLNTILSISMTIVQWAMFLAPFAVFGLVARMASQVGMSTLIGMSSYAGTVIIGLLILICIYYVAILLWKRKNPIQFAKEIASVQLLAFSTSSSAAVMPLSIQTAEKKLGVKTGIAEFIIPFGATINMAGTALYQSVALLFLAQMSGIELGLSQLVFITITLVVSSIGAPGVPGVGIVILATIAANIGIPTVGIILIMGIDRILDMFRTVVNVTGDLTACVIFNKK